MKVPKEVRTALIHVQSLYPEVDLILFGTGGEWRLMSGSLEPVAFDERIDTSILEDAAASIKELPALFYSLAY